jgi:Glycine/D-amino acid oxidases (deaminating)
MNYDFLIVGQGITGSIVALQLKKNSKKFKLIDGQSQSTSSKVATGIVHPISLKRCNLTWRGREFYEFSDSFYKEINFESNIELYKPYKLLRIFTSFEEQNNWIGKTNNKIYKNILSLNNVELDNLKDRFGIGVVELCSRLSVNEFLDFVRTSILKSNCLIKDVFKANELKLKNNRFHYKGDTYSKIIMCEGVNALKNPMFNYLPLIPNKGELLKVFSTILPSEIINCGIFSLPETKNIFTIGSTYSNKDLNPNISIDAKNI